MSQNTSADLTEDFAHVANIPWVSEMIENSQALLYKTIYEWAHTVTQMSDNIQDINRWVESFYGHFNEKCTMYIFDIKELESDIFKRIEESLKKLENLCSVLKIEMPCVGQKKLCLLQEHQQLKNYILEYEAIIEERKGKIKQLKIQEERLCNSLGRSTTTFGDNNGLPSQAEFDEFEEYLNKLETDKFSRLEKFTIIREEILKIIEELKYYPSTEFEVEVCQNENNFSVNDENMELLDNFHRRLIKEVKDVIEESNRLRVEIEQLWNLLDTDLFEREQLRQETSQNNLKTLDILRTEKHKCDILKKENIKVFIDKLRNDLQDVWTQCHCSEDIKNDFQYFYTDCYTEDLLELHENELTKWRQYYKEHRQLLGQLVKHKQLWLKMLEFDQNASGPNRYNNRGGQLLKEEKERNRLSKLIPKIEEELCQLGAQYEERTGHPFFTFGQTIDDYISSLHADRENIKKKTLSAKKLQRDKLTPGNSIYATSKAHITSSAKRKLPFTPIPETEKKQKLIGSCKSNRVVRKLIIPKIKVTCSTSKRYSIETKKAFQKTRKSLSQRTDQTFSTGYGEFQSELSNKAGCRSTLVDLEPPSTPRKRLKTPSSNSKRRPPQSPRTDTKLTAARSNLKLLF